MDASTNASLINQSFEGEGMDETSSGRVQEISHEIMTERQVTTYSKQHALI